MVDKMDDVFVSEIKKRIQSDKELKIHIMGESRQGMSSFVFVNGVRLR